MVLPTLIKRDRDNTNKVTVLSFHKKFANNLEVSTKISTFAPKEI